MNIENLKKQAKTLVRQHRSGYYPVAARLGAALPRLAGLPDAEILRVSFTMADALEVIAHERGFANWALAKRKLGQMPNRTEDHVDEEPRLLVAYPQLFVRDVARAAEFYEQKLGFRTVYLYGQPPFYGLVERDGAGLNLRHVDRPVIDQALREKEDLLSANIPVRAVKTLFLRFKERGVEFEQTLKRQPWGATDFIVRDPDGNLICFGSAAEKTP